MKGTAPMSKKLALIGLDGSGKSANIDQMKCDPAYTDYSFMWVRWKPFLLRPAYWILEKKLSKKTADLPQKAVDGKNTAKQAKLNADYQKKSGLKDRMFRNPVIRSSWMGLALVDYFFQFHFKTAPLILGHKNVIFDRFYLDLFVDQGINFGYSPERIDRAIRRSRWLFPEMDQIIYIRVSPQTCYQRKDDIPNMEYLNRRFEIYETLARNNNWIVVDGEEPFKTVNNWIKKVILG